MSRHQGHDSWQRARGTCRPMSWLITEGLLDESHHCHDSSQHTLHSKMLCIHPISIIHAYFYSFIHFSIKLFIYFLFFYIYHIFPIIFIVQIHSTFQRKNSLFSKNGHDPSYSNTPFHYNLPLTHLFKTILTHFWLSPFRIPTYFLHTHNFNFRFLSILLSSSTLSSSLTLSFSLYPKHYIFPFLFSFHSFLSNQNTFFL